MRFSYQRLVHYIYHHYLSIIAVAALLTVVAVYFAGQLRVKSNIVNLLPADHVSVSELTKIQARVGGIGPLMIVITGDDIDKSLDFMLTLADSLEHNAYISSVSRGKDSQFWSSNRLLYMDYEDLETIYSRVDDYVEEEKVRHSPLYFSFEDEEANTLDFSDLEAKYEGSRGSKRLDNYYLTKEGNGVILRVYPSGIITDVSFSQRLFNSLDHTITSIDPKSFHPSIEYRYKGAFKNSSYEYQLVIDDLKSTAVYGLLGVLVLISLYFRQVFASIFIVFPLLMGVAWTFGLTYLVIENLNLVTVGLFAILFGLGIDFGIHIFARYREARRRGIDIEEALTITVCHTGSALTTTAITTSGAFFSLMVTEFKGFSEFGFIVGFGILFSLAAMLVVCPAFIILAERLRVIRLHQSNVPAHLFRRGKYPFAHLTVLLAAIATGYSIYNVSSIEFEYDFSKLKPAKPPGAGSLPESLKETRSPAIVLTENFEEASEVVATVKEIKSNHGDSSTVSSVKSVYSALPKRQSEKLDLIEKLKTLIDESERYLDHAQRVKVDSLRPYMEVAPLVLEDLPGDVTKQFSSKDGELLNIVMINSAVPLKDGRQAIRFTKEVKKITTQSGRVYHASSAHIIFAEMLEIMLDDSVLAIVLTLVVVTTVLLIDLRNFTHTLLVLTPLLTALLLITGFMYLFEIRLNLYNMVAFPTVIGMGIDNGVHMFHRYREEGAGSLKLVLRTTGVALLATSLTTMVGFSGLIPANHPALPSIGILSLIGLGCCFVTAITLLPALLQIRENRNRPHR